MISIKRTSCPDVLKRSPQKGTLYNRKKVVERLWDMQYGKCCYCEQFLPKKGHLKAVEHFEPKSIYKERKNDWKNLLIVCAQCNGKKSDKFPTMLTNEPDEDNVIYLDKKKQSKTLLIDPSDPSIVPEDHIAYNMDDTDDSEFTIPFERNNSLYGRTTIDIIGLCESYYIRKTREFYDDVLDLAYNNLLKAKHLSNTIRLENFCLKFEMLMSAKGSFTAFAREFARAKKLNQRFNITIPVGSEV
jgi:uncharacterized protein (TIGR02646 family)